jgi:hypothetical protein
MFNTHYIYSAIMAGSIVVVGLGGPLSLFEFTQPGHSANKYYQELHPSPAELVQIAMTRAVPVSPRSEIAEAPTIVIPTANIIASPPK